MNVLRKIRGKLKKIPKIQIIVAICASVLFTGIVSTAGYVIYDYERLPVEMASATVIEPSPEEEVFVEEPILEQESEDKDEDEIKELSLIGSSIEKDLKIKIEDQHSRLVTGEVFTVSVKSEKKGSVTTEYQDKDKDGIIYINKLASGDYTVILHETEGYKLKKSSITVTVKDNIEYKKVDVADEIKKESQINTAVEDTAINNVPVENTLTDTLPLLESKIIASPVDKSDVDTSIFTKASASQETVSATCRQITGISSEVIPPLDTTEPEPPSINVPDTNTPVTDVPDTETPDTDTPAEDTTDNETPGTEVPDTETPDTNTPAEDTTDNGTPGTEVPDTETNNLNVPDSEGSVPPVSSDADSESDKLPSAVLTETEVPAAPESKDADENENNSVNNITVSIRSMFQRLGNAFTLQATAASVGSVQEKTATVAVPANVTLYNCDNTASNSYKMDLSVSGEKSIIKGTEWICSDAKVISLSAKEGSSVTVTAKMTGTAEVSAKVSYISDDKGTVTTVSVKSKITVSNLTDAATVLKDKSGNTLYLDDNAQTQATLKDYSSQDVFYTAPRYTGWRTIDGKVYYFNENYQPVTGQQVIGGVIYNFSSDGSLEQSSGNRGIDVSKYQGNIDWGAVSASGINFAIIRVGYRGSSTGVLVEDPYFRQNIAGATKAGIKVGVYFFTQAVTKAEAVEEASMAMSLVSGYKMTYPIFIDTESASNGRANSLSKSERTAIVNAFCQTVRSGGYKAGVYASKSWFNNQLNTSALNGYCIWVAQYNSECTYSGKKDIWQYTSSGKVSGIKGNVDMNISYTGY